MPTYKLRYFKGIRGRIEYIRFMFAAAGVPLEDDPVNPPDWPTEKEKQPFLNTLPVFFEDGKVLCTTLAIARYVARKFGFAGENDWDAAQVDMYTDGYNDMFNGMTKVVPHIRSGDMVKAKETYDEIAPEKLKPFMDKYEGFLKQNGGDWFVGKKPTFADFAVAEILQRFQEIFQPNIFDGYPALKAHKERIFAIPGVKSYVASRPAAPF